MPKVMKSEPDDLLVLLILRVLLSPLASGLEGRLNVFDAAFRLRIVENEFGGMRKLHEGFRNRRIHRDLPRSPAFRILYENITADKIDVRPFETENLAPLHAGIQSDNQDRADRFGRVLDQAPSFLRREDPLPGIVFLEFSDGPNPVLLDPPPLFRLIEERLQASKLSINSRRQDRMLFLGPGILDHLGFSMSLETLAVFRTDLREGFPGEESFEIIQEDRISFQ